MKLTILDGHAVNPGDLPWDSFSRLADVTIYERTPPELVRNRIGDSDAIFLNKISITEEILGSCPKLKYIGVLATGYNVIDLEACRRRGITVTNIPSYSTASVAQHVFAFILHFTNHVALHDASVRAGDWKSSPDFCYWKAPLTELSGKTLGIFGYGSIGRRVSELGKAFGMRVICTTRTQRPGSPEAVPFGDLCRRSDFMSLHAPLTEQTRHIINGESLGLFKSTACLINTARGGLVDEQALAEALGAGRLSGYAADVLEGEPMDGDCPLFGIPGCIITPHIAWAPLETRARLQKIAYDNLRGWLEGKPLNVVS